MSKAENQGRMPDPYKMLGLGDEGNLGIPVISLQEPLRADTSPRDNDRDYKRAACFSAPRGWWQG